MLWKTEIHLHLQQCMWCNNDRSSYSNMSALTMTDSWKVFVLVVFALNLLLGSNTTSVCNMEPTCFANRPKRQDGCCPLLGGEQCNSTADQQCDTELGYNCTKGICKGRSDLKVVHVEQTTVKMTWKPFLTEPNNFEYSVLYTTDFTLSLLQWNSHGITLKIPSTSRSHSRCFVCKRPGPKLVCLSADGRLSTFLVHNVVIPAGSRCCPRHIHEGGLIHSAVTSIQTKTDTTKLNRTAINDLLQKMRSLCLQMNKSLNFDSLNDSDYPSLTRLTKSQFDDVCRHLTDKVKNSPSRSSRTSIGIFLVKLCSGMSNRLLSTIFGITKSSVRRAVSTVRQAFMRGFVPLYLGIDSLTRESVIRDHTRDLAKTLFGTADDQVILVLDGTYIYINKSNNFKFQRRTYCTHKGRPLVKPMVVVTTTGYFVTIVGPYLSDSKNNDASILNHMLMSNIEDIRCFLKDGDVFVVDRGFRDSVKLLEELGIQAEMPSILSKGHRQMSTEEANSSRLVTKVENRTEVTLYELVPDTWYFSCIGIWTAGNYSNLTETIVFKTKARDYCLYDGRQITVGQKLVVEQCEETCICRRNGTFHCVPVCRKHDQETPVCDEYFTEPYCCDVQHQCAYDNCSYLGENVKHMSSWLIDCAENCTCYDGMITCAPHCNKPSKPRHCAVEPVMVKSPDGCCNVWECREPDNVCYYGNNTILPGTIFFHGDCQLCTCSDDFRDTKCIDFHRCGTISIPERTPVCPKPVVVENVCCNQVICQHIESEIDDVVELWTVSMFSDSSVVVRLQFITEADENDIDQIILFYTNKTDVELPHWRNFTFNMSDANNIVNSSHFFTEFGAPNILYKIDKSFFFLVPYLQMDLFYYLVLNIHFSSETKAGPGRNSTNTSTLWSDTIATKLPETSFSTPSTLSRSAPTNETMSFTAENTSSTSAFLFWTVPTSFKYKIASFVIKYKPLSAKNWFYTERLIFSVSNYMLTCLFHTKWYEAHLLSIPGERRLGTTFFHTLSVTESENEKYFVNIYDVDIDVTSAALRWFPFPDEVIPTVFNMEVLWYRDTEKDNTYKYCINSDSETYIVEGLLSGTMYTAWVAVNLKSGQTVFSHRVHFVTSSLQVSSHSTNNHSIIVAITVSCISLITMVTAIITIVYLTRCKRRLQYETHSAFENRIFQIYSNQDEPEL